MHIIGPYVLSDAYSVVILQLANYCDIINENASNFKGVLNENCISNATCCLMTMNDFQS